MSRREGRDSHARRLQSSSRSHRDDPSPRRTRDDRRRETDRTHTSSRATESAKTFDHEQKIRRSLQAAAQHENPSSAQTKSLSDAKNDSATNHEKSPRGTKRYSDSRETLRSHSYFQHDERGSAGQGGRRYDRQASDRGRHRDQREHLGDRDQGKAEDHGFQKKSEQSQPRSDGDSVWKHDGFFRLQEEVPPAKRRPSFKETKVPLEPETAAKADAEPDSRSCKPDQCGATFVRREERSNYRSRGFDKPEGAFTRPDDRNARREFPDQRSAGQRNGYDSRGSFASRGGRGGDRFNNLYGGRNTHMPADGQAEKWKHDLYDETNRSPTPKNEEEQIAKVEALLAL